MIRFLPAIDSADQSPQCRSAAVAGSPLAAVFGHRIRRMTPCTPIHPAHCQRRTAALCCLLTGWYVLCTAGFADEPATSAGARTNSGRAALDKPAPTTPGHSLLRSRKTSPPAAADPFLETQESPTSQPAGATATPRITPRRPPAESGKSMTERLRLANRGSRTLNDRTPTPDTAEEPPQDIPVGPAPAPAADPETAPADGSDPSMLSRLRGLYSPKIDENTERLRKQMLRLSDPFGLIHERETAETQPAAEETETPTTATAEVLPTLPETPEITDRDLALTAAITLLEDELKHWPRNSAGRPENLPAWRRRQTDLRLLMMIAGRSAESIRTIEALPREEQEFWQSMMLAMNQYRTTDESIPRSDLLGETLRQIRTAERRLQPLARLEINRLQFCSRINGFGSVVAFPTADFEPGQRLLLYVGLRNFRSELTAEGRYRTESAAVIEYIREEDGEALEPVRLPSIPDECDEQRTDYYQSIELTAPLLEGSWLVRVRVRDQYSMQTAEAQLKLNVR